jgi:hypothetical protein
MEFHWNKKNKEGNAIGFRADVEELGFARTVEVDLRGRKRRRREDDDIEQFSDIVCEEWKAGNSICG